MKINQNMLNWKHSYHHILIRHQFEGKNGTTPNKIIAKKFIAPKGQSRLNDFNDK